LEVAPSLVRFERFEKIPELIVKISFPPAISPSSAIEKASASTPTGGGDRLAEESGYEFFGEDILMRFLLTHPERCGVSGFGLTFVVIILGRRQDVAISAIPQPPQNRGF
jgi:hypothetical protein